MKGKISYLEEVIRGMKQEKEEEKESKGGGKGEEKAEKVGRTLVKTLESFQGDEGAWPDWSFKFRMAVSASDGRLGKMLDKAEKEQEEIGESWMIRRRRRKAYPWRRRQGGKCRPKSGPCGPACPRARRTRERQK